MPLHCDNIYKYSKTVFARNTMGISFLRSVSTTGLVAFVVVVCSLTLSVAGQRQGNCSAKLQDGRVLGQCVPVRGCEYFMNILRQQTLVSEADRNVLRENRCSLEQPEVYVCCPLDANRKGSSGLLPSVCGAAKWQPNNDTETKITEYPWLALIEYTKPNQEKLHACGGVLISERYVLTAAHCVSSSAIINLGWQVKAVRLGEWDTMTNPDCQNDRTSGATECAPPFQDVIIEDVIVHSLYNMNSISQTHDIALIRLAQPVQLNDFVQPICLPKKQSSAGELEELIGEVAGWQAKSSSRMQKSSVTITSIESCQQQYAARQVTIAASQLCGAANANECRGNSGGPLMIFKNNGYVLDGLLSFGPVPCPNPGWPDIYTRVGSYIDWIHENLKA